MRPLACMDDFMTTQGAGETKTLTTCGANKRLQIGMRWHFTMNIQCVLGLKSFITLAALKLRLAAKCQFVTTSLVMVMMMIMMMYEAILCLFHEVRHSLCVIFILLLIVIIIIIIIIFNVHYIMLANAVVAVYVVVVAYVAAVVVEILPPF